MKVERLAFLVTVCLISLGLVVGSAIGAPPSLEKWKPAFDPSGAKYKCVVSNVSHPVLKGVYAGFAIRDELWKRTNGQIYFDFKPFSMLGGEVEDSTSSRWALFRAWDAVPLPPPTLDPGSDS